MSAREIPKLPEVPELTSEKIALLTELCFRNDTEVPPVDLIFVFGSAICFQEMKQSIQTVIPQSKQLLLTGGIEKYIDSSVHDLPESTLLYEVIKDALPSELLVFCETKSRNTYENLKFGLQLVPQKPTRVCFIAKSFHAGRAYLTLKKFLPDSVVYQRTFDPIYPRCKMPMTRSGWWKEKEYSARIWGEFLRIKKYGDRGDLILDEAQDLITAIEELNDQTFS
jgi:hypothetical protein